MTLETQTILATKIEASATVRKTPAIRENMRPERLSMKTTSWIVALAIVGLSAAAGAQKPDADAQKLADTYAAAFNKGDSKALAALYAPQGTRLGPDGQLVSGRPAVEKVYADGFAGPLKGAKLTLEQGLTYSVTPDVKIMEGRFTVASLAAIKGRYINTVVRQGKAWLLASVVTIPDPPPPAK
jgi:uncharacterized protein (TIGR02246 family)